MPPSQEPVDSGAQYGQIASPKDPCYPLYLCRFPADCGIAVIVCARTVALSRHLAPRRASSAGFEPQGRRQDLRAHDRLSVRARPVFTEIFPTDMVDRGPLDHRDRRYRPVLAVEFQGGPWVGREIAVPAPLVASDGTHEDLAVRHRDPDHHSVRGVLLGPDRDLLQ